MSVDELNDMSNKLDVAKSKLWHLTCTEDANTCYITNNYKEFSCEDVEIEDINIIVLLAGISANTRHYFWPKRCLDSHEKRHYVLPIATIHNNLTTTIRIDDEIGDTTMQNSKYYISYYIHAKIDSFTIDINERCFEYHLIDKNNLIDILIKLLLCKIYYISETTLNNILKKNNCKTIDPKKLEEVSAFFKKDTGELSQTIVNKRSVDAMALLRTDKIFTLDDLKTHDVLKDYIKISTLTYFTEPYDTLCC